MPEQLTKTARLGSVTATNDRADHEQSGDGDELAAEDHAVEVERGLPGDVVAPDDISTDGPGTQTEASARALVPFVLLSLAHSAASHDQGGGNDRDPVLLIGISVDALHRDRVAGVDDRLRHVHG